MPAKKLIIKKHAAPPAMEQEASRQLFFPGKAEQARTLFSKLVVDDIINNIYIGLTLEDAAHLVNIPTKAVNKWYNENFCNFKYAVDNVNAKNKKIHVSRVLKGSKEWRPSSWWLERKHKQEFSKEITITVNHVIIDQVSKIMADAVLEFVKDPEELMRAKKYVNQKLLELREDDFPAQVAAEVVE